MNTKNGVAIFEQGQHPRDIRKSVEKKEVVVTTESAEEVKPVKKGKSK